MIRQARGWPSPRSVTVMIALLAPLQATADEVRVYAAASLTNAVTSLAKAYESANLGNVTLVTGSSGALAHQIVQGAPADVYLSANRTWVDYLIENDAIAADDVAIFASNSLVLIAPQTSTARLDEPAAAALRVLLDDRRVVIGDPEVAPVGDYARQALRALDLWRDLEPSLIFAPNAMTALTYVSRDAADFAIVYATDAALDGVHRVTALPASSHAPIRYYAAAVLGGDTDAATAFVGMLVGPVGRALLDEQGFLPAQTSDHPQ